MPEKPLLHDVLRSRSQGLEQLSQRLQRVNLRRSSSTEFDTEEDDDELVAVQSVPGSPSISRVSSRASSPTRASARPVKGPLILSASTRLSSDPLRAFPTEVSQLLFGLLSIYDLKHCANVCKRWRKSQTLNYVWFQHYRRDSFLDDGVPLGKWTRRESKQNWKRLYLEAADNKDSSFSTPLRSHVASGTHSPREIREERWKSESEAQDRPNKLQMREMYKEYGGRKPKSKGKLAMGVGGGGNRDRGGWDNDETNDW